MLNYPISAGGHIFPANIPIGVGRMFYSMSNKMADEMEDLRQYVLIQGVIVYLPPEAPFDPRNN